MNALQKLNQILNHPIIDDQHLYAALSFGNWLFRLALAIGVVWLACRFLERVAPVIWA